MLRLFPECGRAAGGDDPLQLAAISGLGRAGQVPRRAGEAARATARARSRMYPAPGRHRRAPLHVFALRICAAAFAPENVHVDEFG